MNYKSRFNVDENIPWLGLFINLIISLYFIFTLATVNHDGILYLRAAHAYVHDGWHAANALYNWPFYSVMIGTVHQIFGSSYFASAFVINLICQSIMVYTLLKISKHLGATPAIQYLLLFVLFVYPPLNHYRTYIVRDFGYWGFYLTGIYYLIRFAEKPAWSFAFLWSAAMFIAFLFRVEALGFILFTPLALFFVTEMTWRERFWRFVQAHSVLIIAGTLFLLAISQPENQSTAIAGRLETIKYQLFHWNDLLFARFFERQAIFADQILTKFSDGHATYMLFISMLAYYFVKLFSGFTYLFSALFAYTLYKRRDQLQSPATKIVYAAMVIYMGITMLFVGQEFFISTRYMVGLYLLMMLWLPYGIQHLYAAWRLYSHDHLCA